MNERQFEIITAAGRLLTRSGVAGLTIKNLASEMKFTESAIYRHFKSKEAIIIAMLDYLAQTMDDRLRSVLEGVEGAEAKLTALFHDQFQFFKDAPHFLVAVFSDGLLEQSHAINESILNIMQMKTKHLLPLIVTGQKEGVFTTTVEADHIRHIVMGAFRLHMFKWRTSQFQFDIVTTGDALVESILVLIHANRK
ncbi:MAG: TetR/AcrR family transcriptional regulator [Bacteroidetes bacterium]|jgi:TetR/AcrR family fatty acid metabolism transcriptional regulator|nr:TetR/AcrR family transcriptional regulator [Bacteroidota bacterium]MBP6639569.1 TetR/AcrR family transcriptional regulator [Bacteroidia bacterium]